MNEEPLLVAIVDDDPSVGASLRRLLMAIGHQAIVFTSGHGILYGMANAKPTHVILDFHMPPPSGAVLVARVHERWPETRILVMSGLEMDGAADECLAAGASHLLKKPICAEDLGSFLASSRDPAD